MLLNALDYSFARPDVPSMAKGGIRLVSRYLYASGKGLGVDERGKLHANGIAINANYEGASGMVLEGPQAAVGHAETALQRASDLGFPLSCSVDYSADRDIRTQADYALLGKFFETANDRAAGRPVGVYGEYDVIEWLWTRGLVSHAWQTLAWSGRNPDGTPRIHSKACLYQFSIDNLWGGAAVDFNTILNPAEAFKHAWMPLGAEQPDSGDVTPIPTPDKQEEDEMYWLIQNSKNGEVRACGPNYWYGFAAATAADRIRKIRTAQQDPLCGNNGVIRRVSPQGMQDLHDQYVGPGVVTAAR